MFVNMLAPDKSVQQSSQAIAEAIHTVAACCMFCR
jgi:hypothetical protein